VAVVFAPFSASWVLLAGLLVQAFSKGDRASESFREGLRHWDVDNFLSHRVKLVVGTKLGTVPFASTPSVKGEHPSFSLGRTERASAQTFTSSVPVASKAALPRW